MPTQKTGDAKPRPPMTPNPDLAKTTGEPKGGKVVKGTATPTKRG
jgi:hypothetical protein